MLLLTGKDGVWVESLSALVRVANWASEWTANSFVWSEGNLATWCVSMVGTSLIGESEVCGPWSKPRCSETTWACCVEHVWDKDTEFWVDFGPPWLIAFPDPTSLLCRDSRTEAGSSVDANFALLRVNTLLLLKYRNCLIQFAHVFNSFSLCASNK